MRYSFKFIDAHTCGNPIRIVTDGITVPHGLTASAAVAHIRDNSDWMRSALMLEPRGHDMMAGAILLPTSDNTCDASVVFMDTGGYLSMCGHGAIGLVTAALEHKLVAVRKHGQFVLETPAGRVQLTYELNNGRVSSVALECVPSFLAAQNIKMDLPGVGRITLDLAFGGNFCAIVEPQQGLPLLSQLSQEQMVLFGTEIRHQLDRIIAPVHPLNGEIRGVKQVMWCGSATQMRTL